MKKIFGNKAGLKSSQIRRFENLYRRRIPPEWLITPDMLKEMRALSHETGRQIGILADRAGKIKYVIAGTGSKIVIPDISEYRAAPGRLKGLRCVHTHMAPEPLTRDDLTDLALLRLDMMAAADMDRHGGPGRVHVAHIIPEASGDSLPCRVLDPLDPWDMDIGCLEMIRAIESELARSRVFHDASGKERAILINAAPRSRALAETSLDELAALAGASGIEVAARVIQRRKKADPKFVIGPGKLQETTITALSKGASLMIFDQELTPSQARSIGDVIELKVIDRTQLILDIFARRARSREGKIQVELAQLQYLLPRLAVKNTAMSRLTGGIGGRGPGETKLEINRRRAREKIRRLKKDLSRVTRRRARQKSKREKKQIPTISIVGYTNAGKSTLLNTLTRSSVRVEDQVFATLDPSSRRLRFPRETEVIITDTVGFIRDLPKDLAEAFRSTIEEMENANLLLHVIDISAPEHLEQMESVEKILADFNLHRIPAIRALNKKDRICPEKAAGIEKKLSGVAISARNAATLAPLISEMEKAVDRISKNQGRQASSEYDEHPSDQR
ncbi:GTPase HflX [Candidatus Desulfarcum epimagneticum]|uniref:GTPase HflX n=1 Tax=uncultured Desulfobacteraceae bacterium TaxID=218296 RepID=A0A484HKQ5_9BACT|nr:GTPase HflX [uncultured Desulfobacteraceae bacterium]